MVNVAPHRTLKQFIKVMCDGSYQCDIFSLRFTGICSVFYGSILNGQLIFSIFEPLLDYAEYPLYICSIIYYANLTY